MRVVVDGRQVRSEADFHALLAGLLDLGPYYGHNLDALWDRLSTDVKRPVELVWTHWEESRANLGTEIFGKIRTILTRVQALDADRNWSERFTFELRGAHAPPA
ncbi:barstar family protein [Planotetraspora kaengkrachanensis]|uniref:Barnase inhibitor n=1 Tax=Planotetraspora kaengkrachanensis TaxID=575193 RepID=A0A8J3M6P5_9ACTN|nr:barstar family protein [Planotetraspora kaengkrachanensis]GIG80361.1 barnase inhibitor [Planotetraspora kaengkrachanensis]